MTIRSRLLLLFGAFGAIPLLATGLVGYVRSERAVAALLARQTTAIAARAAEGLAAHIDIQESDLALLRNNAETQRWLRQAAASDPNAAASRAAAESYAREAWRFFQSAYQFVHIRPARGGDGIVLGGDAFDSSLIERRPIRDEGNAELGTLEFISTLFVGARSLGAHAAGRGASDDFEATPRALRDSPLTEPFGDDGENLVYDLGRDTVVYSTRGDEPGSVAIAEALRGRRAEIAPSTGTFRFRAGGDDRVASFVSLGSAGLTVVATASLDEFAGPLLRARLWELATQLAVVLALVFAFTLLLTRTLRPLSTLTAAADRAAGGDLHPALPAGTRDEVGRLSAAFSAMLTRVREMIGQVESSRQMAVLGEFAAQLAHEIRNPLTAVKLNLQGLERDAVAGRLPPESRESLDIALREVRRLDGVVHGVLRMARTPASPTTFSLGAVVAHTVGLIAVQAERQHVRVGVTHAAGRGDLAGDIDALRGALLNVVLNALEAQPDGGSIEIATVDSSIADVPAVEILIHDTGPGISPDAVDRAFQPFFTTKPEGTGLGLSLALRAVRAHGGKMSIGARPGGGTTVRIALPLTNPEVVA